MPRKGDHWEQIATEHLEDKGLCIIERNYHCYRGEIDIIALDLETVVFVEVKHRGPSSFTEPERALTEGKQSRMITCAKKWIMENNYRGNARFDLVAISGQDLTHYEHAFRLDSL